MKLITEVNENIEIKEEMSNGKKSFFIEGIFLQGDLVNRNKRIYPFNILQNEVSRYIKESVNTKRAFGELSHPCFRKDAEILTVNDGWKLIKDCIIDEEVYTMNPKTKQLEIQKIKMVMDNPSNGNLLHIKNRGIDTYVTHNHRFLIINSRNHTEYKFVTAQEIYDDLIGENKLNKWYIPKASLGLNEEQPDSFIINGSNSIKINSKKKEYYSHPVSIDMETMSAFMGIYLAEGNTRYNPKGNKYKIELYQNEGPKADKIRELLQSMPFKWSEGKTPSRYYNTSKITWRCFDRRLAEYLYPLGKCYNKFVPKEFIKLLNRDNARVFLDYFIMGDGRGELNKKYINCDAFSTSKQLNNDIQQITNISGIAIHDYTYMPDKDVNIEDRIIKKENKSPLHFTQMIQTRGIYLDNRFMTITEEEYNDRVYCVHVPNETFIVKHNGFSFISANCNPGINLDRVSHLITSLKEDGKNYIGKAKILDTPNGKIVQGILSGGGRLGVSSRGMGSIEEKNGINYVQEDFKLATAADIVADPSAPDAFVNGIMEGVEWIYESGMWKQKDLDHAKKQISMASHRKLCEQKMKVFNDMLRKANML